MCQVWLDFMECSSYFYATFNIFHGQIDTSHEYTYMTGNQHSRKLLLPCLSLEILPFRPPALLWKLCPQESRRATAQVCSKRSTQMRDYSSFGYLFWNVLLETCRLMLLSTITVPSPSLIIITTTVPI